MEFVHVSTTSSTIINSTSVGVAGLQPKSKVAPTLITNFGFIPKKKSRDEVADVSMQIRNLIFDPEQATPVHLQRMIN